MGSGKKDVLPVISWYWRDWRASTARAVMSPLARGLYRELLDAHYADDTCSLPNDDRQLAALAGVDLKTWNKVKAEVLPWLPLTEGGRRQNPRSAQEWKQSLNYREAKRENGLKGSAKRWHNHGGTTDQPLAEGSETTDPPLARNSYPPLLSPLSSPPPPPDPLAGPGSPPDGAADGGGGGVAQSAPEQSPEPPPELLATWNRERGTRRSLPDDELTEHHRRHFLALLVATRGDVELATGAIAAYVAMDDQFVRDAAWRIRLFPHRMEAAIAAAAKKRPRRASAPAPTEPTEPPTPVEKVPERMASLREKVGIRRKAAPDREPKDIDAERQRQKEALAAHELEKDGAA